MYVLFIGLMHLSEILLGNFALFNGSINLAVRGIVPMMTDEHCCFSFDEVT